MSTDAIRGIQGLYDECCYGSFYEWAPNSSKHGEGFICSAPIWYQNSEALTLVEHSYDSFDESNSTWKLAAFGSGISQTRLRNRPYKYFQLEQDDDLVVMKCKIRPVLLLKQAICDWRIPGNLANTYSPWLCLPLFSYKPRHSQAYVLDDQALKRPHQFYFPPSRPGLENESAGKSIDLQFIPENNLTPYKRMCDEDSMKKQIKLSEKAYKAVLGHFACFLPGIELAGDSKDWYDFFKELACEKTNELVQSVRIKSN